MSKQWAALPMFAVCVPLNFLLVRFFLKGRHTVEEARQNETGRETGQEQEQEKNKTRI